MNGVDLAWNKVFWEKNYNWRKNAGAEWSDIWGSPASQWNITLYPRIFSFLPASAILEIGQGFGRWTHFLLKYTDVYRAVEMSPKCVQACNEIFLGAHKLSDNKQDANWVKPEQYQNKNMAFYHTDGLCLDMVADKKYDLIFSFDSLVHAGMDVFKSYIPKMINELLSDTGVAFLHHSNMHDALTKGYVTKKQADSYYLERTSSGALVQELIEKSGGRVLSQERFSCLGLKLSNCFTLFCKKDAYYRQETIITENREFDAEVALAKRLDEQYNFVTSLKK